MTVRKKILNVLIFVGLASLMSLFGCFGQGFRSTGQEISFAFTWDGGLNSFDQVNNEGGAIKINDVPVSILDQTKSDIRGLVESARLPRAKGRVWVSVIGQQEPYLVTVTHYELHPNPNDLMHVAGRGETQGVMKLLTEGHTVNEREVPSKRTALMYATLSHKKETVAALLGAGANLADVDYSGKNALLYACNAGDSEIVGYLLKSGANINSTDGAGESCLIVATRARNENLVRLLMSARNKAEYGERAR